MPFERVVYTTLACSCFKIWLCLFSIILLALEITNFFMFLVFITGPAITYWLIITNANKPPNESFVYEIFGKSIERDISTTSDPYVISDDPNEFLMKVIAHRFAGIEAPENSLEALDLCYKNGAVAVEFDLVLTADLVPVIFHDDTLDRMTNTYGPINEKTWSQLKDLDISVKHPFHDKFKGVHIPLLEDVIKKCLEYDLRLFIDVKDDRTEVINSILLMYEKYPKLYKRCIVSSFNGILLYNIRRMNPDIVASMAWRPYYMSCSKYCFEEGKRIIPYSTFIPSYWFARIMDYITTYLFNNVAKELIGFSAVLICKDAITPEIVSYWKEKNVRPFAWTVNNHIEKLHFSRNLGIGYFTDSMLNQ